MHYNVIIIGFQINNETKIITKIKVNPILFNIPIQYFKPNPPNV
jgi:hypothetical protein